jgi:acylphosphatase
MIRRRLLVHGRVQGVFYRDTCRRQARAKGVHGWVANRADGAVEVVLEGESSAVEAMVAWCRRGPRDAEVASVDVIDEEPQAESGFEVRGS